MQMETSQLLLIMFITLMSVIIVATFDNGE